MHKGMYLGMLLAMGLLAGSPSADAEEKAEESLPLTDEQHLEILLEHSYEPVRELTLPMAVRFEDNEGPFVEDQRIKSCSAIAIAATCYAASSLDFEVTMRDLMDNGFWPYNWYPQGIDPDMQFGNFSISGTDISGREYLEWIVENRDDPRWVMDARYNILRASYEMLYRENMVDSYSELERLPKFWYNEIEGRPMIESEADGDYSMVDPYRYQIFMPAFGTNRSEDPDGRKFPLLNYISLPGPYTTNVSANADYDSQYRDMTRSVQPEPEQSTEPEIETELTPEDQKRLLEIMDHTDHRIEFFPDTLDISTPGESVQDRRILNSEAISMAAHLYAIDNLDFEVTMRKLMDNGYWPYYWFPDGLDIDMPFGNFGSINAKVAGKASFRRLVAGRDDPVVIMEGRRDILRTFYKTLYKEDSVDEFDELQRIDAFWFNEVARRPMQESTEAGDYSMVIPDLYDLFGNVTYFVNGNKRTITDYYVPEVRLEDTKRYPLLNFFRRNADGEYETGYMTFPVWGNGIAQDDQ